MSGSDVVKTVWCRALYRIQWTRNGYCYVSGINGSLLGSYNNLHEDSAWAWDDDGRVPDDVRAFALSVKPGQEA